MNLECKNRLGVKVGDVFYSSWGYEQTNINFYVVTRLKGQQFVYLKECYLNPICEDYTSYNGMARDVTFDTNNKVIKYNTTPILRQVKGTIDNPYIKICSFEIAKKYNGEKLYNSWYY